jgi:hypothetical protein
MGKGARSINLGYLRPSTTGFAKINREIDRHDDYRHRQNAFYY